MDKQVAGFKYGINRTTLKKQCGGISLDGRQYKLVLLEADGHPYYSIRLYNKTGRFIKQLMFEPELIKQLADLFTDEIKAVA